MSMPRETFYSAFAEEAEEDIFDTDSINLFTWTPDPLKYPTSKPHEQYKILLDLVLIHAHKVFSTYAFSPELNLNGNVHIHGWYVIKDKYKYFKWFLPKCKSFGFVKVSLAHSRASLETYYKKDIELMNEIMDEYDLPIPLTHVNWESYSKRPILNKRLNLIAKHKTKYKQFW